jgi:hypothetical protein
VTSTGVTGLTATLTSGNFSDGNGSHTYSITGIPNTSGNASFALSIGEQMCIIINTVFSNNGENYPAEGVQKNKKCVFYL